MKKIIALVLMLSMLFSLFAVPMGALAQEYDNNFTISQLLEASSGDEPTESEDNRVNFPIGVATGANSRFFIEYYPNSDADTKDNLYYTGIPADGTWVPGLDYQTAMAKASDSKYYPTGDFAKDKANLYGTDRAGAFVYELDKNLDNSKRLSPLFETKEDGIVWTLDGVDYYVNPTDKAILLYSNVKFDNWESSDDKLKADFEALNGVTLDVPAGNYTSIGFLVSSPSKKLLLVTPIYSDGSEGEVLTSEAFTNNSDTSADNLPYIYTANFLKGAESGSKTSGRWTNTSTIYEPKTFTDIDPTKELVAVHVKNKNDVYPMTIISAWGEKVKELTPLEKINNAEAAMSAITVNSTFEEADEAKKLYEYALEDDNITEESFNQDIVALFNTIYKQIVDKTKLKGTIMVKYFKGEAPTADIEIVNITKAAGKPYKVVLVYYDENDRVLGTYIEDKVSVEDEKVSFTVKAKADEKYENAVKVKGFIWKDFATLIPFAEADEATKKDAFKVLSIGNSYSNNAHKYLVQIAQNAGFERVIVDNLFIGGCSLDTHAKNAEGNLPAYDHYHKELVDGEVVTSTKKEATMLDGIKSQDWDVITIQQGSSQSGKPDTYGKLQSIIDYVNANKTNKDAKIVWHQTWAYADNSDVLDSRYDGISQIEMYNKIVSAMESKVLSLDDIDYVIPAGTAVQNARATSLGDTLTTSDAVHLNELGCYVAGLTWFAKITGMSIDEIDYVPTDITSISDNLDIIKKAVKDAIANPYAVTK